MSSRRIEIHDEYENVSAIKSTYRSGELQPWAITTDVAHQRIHDEVSYWTGHYDAAVVNSGTLTFLFETTSLEVHIIFGAAVGGDFTWDITEGVTATHGTSLTPLNKDRSSLYTSVAVCSHTPTGVSGGMAWPTVYMPGGSGGGPNAIGTTGNAFDREVDLDFNTKYLITMTNISGSTQPASLRLEWYEIADDSPN